MTTLTQFPPWVQGWANPWYWDRNQIPRDAFAHIRDIGFTAVQFVIDVSAVVTGPYKYGWEMRADKDMQVLDDLGFDVILKPMWAAACMTGGLPSNVEGLNGCWVKDPSDRRGWREAVNCGWTEDGIVHLAGTEPYPGACGRPQGDSRHNVAVIVNPANSMDKHPFQPEKPYCMPGNVPHRDIDMERHLAATLAARYGNLTRKGKRVVIGYTRENEPDIRAYNPSMSEPWALAYDRYVREVWTPFIEGVRSVVPDALFIGPEAASPGALRFFHEAAVRGGLGLGGEINWMPSGHMYAQGGVPFPQGTINEIERIGGWRDNMKRAGFEIMTNSEIGAGHNIVADGKATQGPLVDGLRELRDRYPWIISHFVHEYTGWFEGGQEAWDKGRFVRNQLSRDMERLIKGDVPTVPTVPAPMPARVLTEQCYRITDMESLPNRDRGFGFTAPAFLFVALRAPKLIVTRTEALNWSSPFFSDQYIVVAINSGLPPGDQKFTLHIERDIGLPYFGPKMWSELPPVTCAELELETDGTRRRPARS
jgi:hypothetical protein